MMSQRTIISPLILLWIFIACAVLQAQEPRVSADIMRAPVYAAASGDVAPEPTLTPRKGHLGHVLLSLVLPGAGEWVLGSKRTAKFFLGAEAALWLGYFGSKSYVNTLQRDLVGFAALHAGVQTAGKDDQYWIDIGTRNSIYEFNQDKLLERNIDATYAEGGADDWQWESNDLRRDYVGQRLNRLDWKRTTTLTVTGLVLNRLVSMVDVVRLIRKRNSVARQSYLHMNYARDMQRGESVRLNLTWMVN